MFDLFPAQTGRAPESLKSFLRPGVQSLRAMTVHAARLRQLGQGRLVVFLPAYGPTGAALLRIYQIARDIRAFGWRSLILPHTLTLAQRQQFLARLAPDVVVMQGARHALNRPAFYPHHRIVFDMDDADFHLDHLARPVRDAMGQVTAVAAGSCYIADWCRAHGAPRADVIWTGAPISPRARPPQVARAPVVAWSQTRPQTYHREAELVRAVTARLAVVHPGLTLRLYDRRPADDPAFAESFRAPGLTVEWVKSCKYRDYLATFDDVALGLAPLVPDAPFNRGKSFGKVLAYLDREVPVLASDAGEHAAFFGLGLGVLSNDPAVWVAKGAELLAHPQVRSEMAGRARAAFETRLSGQAAATCMDRLLQKVVTGPVRLSAYSVSSKT